MLDLLRPSAASIGFLCVVVSVPILIGIGIVPPDAYWGVVGAASAWAWRHAPARR